MESTVIGVYDDRSQAQNALNELLKAGFAREDVSLSASSDSLSSTAQSEAEGAAEPSGRSGIGGFFSSLFGLDNRQDADIYSEAVRRGSCLLTVNARNDEQHAEIINILDRFNPIDIDERAAYWRSQGWSQYDSSAPPYSDEEVQRDRASYSALQGQASLNQSAGQSALTRPPSQDVSNKSAAATPLSSTELQTRRGARIFQRSGANDMLASDSSVPIDDVVRRNDVGAQQASAAGTDMEYRTHWQNNYGHLGGSYEDHALAYQYGSKLGSNERYRGYRWADLEPEARTDWESNPSATPWEKTKDAVRFAWEKVTGKT